MKRRLPFALIGLLLIACVWLLQRSLFDVRPEEPPLEELIGHTLKNIDLVQGENGSVLWRLKASRGSMNQADGLVRLEQPDITYYMGQDSPDVLVTAQKGEVRQNENLLFLWGDVLGLYEGSRLEAEEMAYDMDSGIAHFGLGADITSDSMTGHAMILEWDTRANIVYGSEGVRMIFTTFD